MRVKTNDAAALLPPDGLQQATDAHMDSPALLHCNMLPCKIPGHRVEFCDQVAASSGVQVHKLTAKVRCLCLPVQCLCAAEPEVKRNKPAQCAAPPQIAVDLAKHPKI